MIIRGEIGTVTDTEHDNVNRPAHYELSGGIEVFDVITDVLGEEVKGFCLGNTIKYICRHKKKGGDEDLRKAKWYLDKYLEIAEKN